MKFQPLQLPFAQSTNDEAFTALKDRDSCLIWTLDQRQGRGSRGRDWISPPGTGLAISFGMRGPELLSPNEFNYPLFAGLLLFDSLTLLGHGDGLSLKWPNDLFLHNRKLGGILCESRISHLGLSLVIGIGLNLRPDPSLSELPKGYASFAETPATPDASLFVETLANHMPNALALYRDQSLLQRHWLSRAWVKPGMGLTVQLENETITGTFSGLGKFGELLLDTEGGQRSLQQPALIEHL